MTAGSHLGFIQELVTFEPFEITTPNLAARCTNPEFNHILKFSIFQNSKKADGGYIGFIQELGHWVGKSSFRTHSIFIYDIFL